MKKLIYILTFAVLISCNSDNSSSDKKSPSHQADLTIDGMVCEKGCVGSINKKLGGLDGVVDFEVVFEDKKATVTYDLEKLNKTELIKNIEELHNGMYKVIKSTERCISNCEETPNEITPKSSSEETKNTPDVKFFNNFRLPNVFKILNSLLNNNI